MIEQCVILSAERGLNKDEGVSTVPLRKNYVEHGFEFRLVPR